VIALITAVLANRREAMPDSSLRRHTINVDHVQISCARPFAKVWAALQKDAPALDPQIYRIANQTESAIKVIMCFSEAELEKIAGILSELGLSDDRNIVVIDADRSNKVSASNVG
jgi:hypothetical protein